MDHLEDQDKLEGQEEPIQLEPDFEADLDPMAREEACKRFVLNGLCSTSAKAVVSCLVLSISRERRLQVLDVARKHLGEDSNDFAYLRNLIVAAALKRPPGTKTRSLREALQRQRRRQRRQGPGQHVR